MDAVGCSVGLLSDRSACGHAAPLVQIGLVRFRVERINAIRSSTTPLASFLLRSDPSQRSRESRNFKDKRKGRKRARLRCVRNPSREKGYGTGRRSAYAAPRYDRPADECFLLLNVDRAAPPRDPGIVREHLESALQIGASC